MLELLSAFPGRVLLPLDLLDFKEAHRPALLRAFGGSVLAVDNATAAELAQRYGLSSVTPDGTVGEHVIHVMLHMYLSFSCVIFLRAHASPRQPVLVASSARSCTTEIHDLHASFALAGEPAGHSDWWLHGPCFCGRARGAAAAKA